jgi:hypothetical protein
MVNERLTAAGIAAKENAIEVRHAGVIGKR